MLDVLPLSFSSDAAVLQTWKRRSYTPVVGQLLSLPPHLRQTFHGTCLHSRQYAYMQFVVYVLDVYMYTSI